MDLQGLLNTALSISIVFTFIFIVPNSATLSKSDKKDKKARSNKSGSTKTLKEKWRSDCIYRSTPGRREPRTADSPD